MTIEIKKPKGKYKKCSFNDPFIYVVDNALPKKFCKKVIKKFEKDSEKGPGITGSGYVENVKKSTDLFISPLPNWEKEDKVFHSSLHEQYLNYLDTLPRISFTNLLNLVDTGYQVQRTDPKGYYTFHHDFSAITVVRQLTFIWYLNDIKNDGYTEFIDGTKVQPKAGRFLMFPATWTYVHRGYPPKDEVKYICTGWMSIDSNENDDEDDRTES